VVNNTLGEKAGRNVSKISAQLVKELRETTGAGLMECKKALVEVDGDLEKAVTILRKRGVATAEKKAGRATTEGLISAYVHAGSKIGVLVEVACETDFVAKTPDFQELVKDLAMQVAAASPSPARFLTRDEVPEDVLAKERDVLTSQAEQPFIKDPDMTVEQLITSKIALLKENIQIRRFVRYVRGEPL
jgi:elongation factor Ts